jgi:hypothetical protein
MANRDTPDLAALAAINDPEEFVWEILPHAARSFATSILVLPRRKAWAAAIAYLYCRILDTYEDLHPDVAARPELLRSFGERFGDDEPASPPMISTDVARDDRDRAHLLLIERIALIDSAYRDLAAADRASISELVHNMADGMAWAAETLAAQDGVLEDAAQRARYCHYVIGEPALYAILGAAALDAAATTRVRRVREELLLEALSGVDAYARLVDELASSGVSQARGAAVLMLSFTDRYYSRCAVRAGHAAWPGARRSIVIYANSIMATLSARWANRVITGIVDRFHRASDRIGRAARHS